MRGILLDTHAVLWYLAGDARQLPRSARGHIEDAGVDVFVSAVSVWEVAIKAGAGRLKVGDDLLERIAGAHFARLDITLEHALAVRDLPDHHRDPFDRLLIAQASVEDLLILTRDAAFDPYGVPTGWG